MRKFHPILCVENLNGKYWYIDKQLIQDGSSLEIEFPDGSVLRAGASVKYIKTGAGPSPYGSFKVENPFDAHTVIRPPQHHNHELFLDGIYTVGLTQDKIITMVLTIRACIHGANCEIRELGAVKARFSDACAGLKKKVLDKNITDLKEKIKTLEAAKERLGD